MSQFFIAFDESHKPRGKISGNYSNLRGHLEAEGFNCQTIMEFPLTRKNLAPFDILAIPCPDFSKISKDEIEAITKWVNEDGGGLIMLSHAGGDKGRRSNLSDLAEKFGMQFENDQVLDSSNNFGIENLPELKTFSPPHPITDGITSICFRAGCSLSTFGMTAIPVMNSNEESEPFSTPLCVAAEAGDGRVIGIGSYEVFRDKIMGGFNQDEHPRLASNIFQWLKTDYRGKIKTGEVKPKFLNNPPINNQTMTSPSLNTMDLNGQPQVPNQSASGMNFQSINIESTIKISDKSDLAGLLYGLLNEVDSLKGQIQNIINSVVASEEQIMQIPSVEIPNTSVEEKFDISNELNALGTPTPDDEFIIAGSTAETMFVPPVEGPLSPMPLKPPSMLSKPTKEEGLSMPPGFGFSPEPVLAPREEQIADVEEQVFETAPTPEITIPEIPLEEIQAELETLQSKLSSIEDLRKLVDNKFKKKKYTKKQYEKQIKRLDNDKKKATFRIDELEEILRKM